MNIKCPLTTLNQRLVLITILLGIGALIIGNPISNSAKINTKELSLQIDETKNKIKPEELADWIIKQKADYKLIDLRDENKFNEYHINNSENIQLQSLIKSGLSKTQKIILYSDGDGFISAQAWFLLKSKNYKNVYILDGGIDAWKKKILFPSLSSNATQEEKESFEKMKQVSKYFGGTPLGVDSSGTNNLVNLPKLSAPQQTKSSAPSGGKPKKEGC